MWRFVIDFESSCCLNRQLFLEVFRHWSLFWWCVFHSRPRVEPRPLARCAVAPSHCATVSRPPCRQWGAFCRRQRPVEALRWGDHQAHRTEPIRRLLHCERAWQTRDYGQVGWPAYPGQPLHCLRVADAPWVWPELLNCLVPPFAERQVLNFDAKWPNLVLLCLLRYFSLSLFSLSIGLKDSRRTKKLFKEATNALICILLFPDATCF